MWFALLNVILIQLCRLSALVEALDEGTDCAVKTTSGVCCVFPFIYGSLPYRSCVTAGNGNTLWCATTSNYNADKKWGDCRITEHPYRWVPTHGRATTQSTTVAGHEAYHATDGDYNKAFPPLQYSQTTVSDKPYLQVDMGKSMPVDFVTFQFPMLTDPPKRYQSIKVTLSGTSTFAGGYNCWGIFNPSAARSGECNKWGRYITIQSRSNAVELSIIEIAAHRRPVESVALNKPTTRSSVYGAGSFVSRTVDMNFESHFATNQETRPWIRVDLVELYYIYEVVIWLRRDCCNALFNQKIAVRAGRSLANNGNSNHLCGTHMLYEYEIRSFYCKVIGRYVNVHRLEEQPVILDIGEIVVNPETTDNVAIHSTNSANIKKLNGNAAKRLTDGHYHLCHVMVESTDIKELYITMGATYDVYKILIVGNPTKLDTLVDFDIKVGMAGKSKFLCFGVRQHMAGIYTKAFYCSDSRTGNEIYIRQFSSEKTISICEVAVFSEAKPAINRSKDHYVWAEENTDQLFLTCEAKGFPTPVLSWVRNTEIIQSETSTLELTALSVNHTGEYECWANNTHGADVKVVDLVVTSHLRVCVDFKEIQFKVGKSESEEFEFRGNQWYSFYDPDNGQSLQFFESSPKRSSGQLWLKGKHPKVQDGVVSRQLCMKRECSTKYDVYVRRCASSYVYNFRDLRKVSSSMTFCFKNAKNLQSGVNPVIASPKYGHALSGSVFRTEIEVQESYNCLVMCQLSPDCKSFNFSKKKKVCELNSATKKEFPKNYGVRSGYDYYQFGKGMVVARRAEL